MAIRINNISLNIEEPKDILKEKVAKKLKIKKEDIINFKIIRESIDARKKDNINFIYTVQIETLFEDKILLKNKDVVIVQEEKEEILPGNKLLTSRPIVIGFGPAGIFAALTLARKGYAPIVYERGEDVDNRTKTVESFWAGKSKLNLESNVQFGEGGAGAFSDGKLTTRIKDNRCLDVLETFVKAGAPEEIIYEGKPHVGTDLLKGVVKNIREEIKALGGEVHFNSKLEKINIRDKKLSSIIVNGNEIPCEALILAIGHSSRDTYEMLWNEGVFMESKAFAIGVRVEHPQELINRSQYGKYANHPRLKAADYRLATQSSTGRGVYSFCMCPGGVVVAAASEEERLVTNGMSYHARDLENANSALVVTVGPKDFGENTPLSGMEFQRHYESLAYKLGGGDYKAPVQLIGDFLNDRKSNKIGSVKPSYMPGYELEELKKALPSFVVDSLKEGISIFDKKINGYGMDDGVLTGIETRTSAPVRITRNSNLESIDVKGIYPSGEGAGFAGGIISAAVDGIKVAENIIKEYKIK
ncbi:MAG: FAD-dependent oxidoreductase [Clostridiales bacterium]|nr:FAD-dependent oxidoreductase [Clostridiales bacterium]